MVAAIVVRDASAADIEDVRSVAAAAWRDTYAGLLSEATIEGFLARSYSVERVARRVSTDTFLLATAADGSVVAFANAREAEGHLHLLAIYASPAWRGRGAGSALLRELRTRFPTQRISAEVLRGNRKGEAFYEARGFVPGEIVEAELFGEPLVERRWWLAAEDAGH
jgi:ribosomal protein S18 acetylase RimI-like enzyme